MSWAVEECLKSFRVVWSLVTATGPVSQETHLLSWIPSIWFRCKGYIPLSKLMFGNKVNRYEQMKNQVVMLFTHWVLHQSLVVGDFYSFSKTKQHPLQRFSCFRRNQRIWVGPVIPFKGSAPKTVDNWLIFSVLTCNSANTSNLIVSSDPALGCFCNYCALLFTSFLFAAVCSRLRAGFMCTTF